MTRYFHKTEQPKNIILYETVQKPHMIHNLSDFREDHLFCIPLLPLCVGCRTVTKDDYPVAFKRQTGLSPSQYRRKTDPSDI